MSYLNGETVDVLTAQTATDPYSGVVTDDWDLTPTEAPVAGVAVEPRPVGEPTQDARNSITNGFTLYMPTGTAITARNRVRVRGTVYQVDGEPADWRSPFSGWRPGVVVQCKDTVG